MPQLHATCVVIGETGVLINGPSGAGKSDLALRLIDGGAMLVADDRTDITMRDGALWASAPKTIRGQMEVRGIGIIAVTHQDQARLGIAIDIDNETPIERMPDPAIFEIEGIAIAAMRLNAREASAPAKVRLAVAHLAGSTIACVS